MTRVLSGVASHKAVAATAATVVAAALIGCAQTPPPASSATGEAPAPLAGKLTVTPAADIPIDKIRLPPGFKVELWASGIPGAHAMSVADNGKVYVGTRAIGHVYEVTDNGKDRTSRILIDKLVQPAGVEFHKGSLYVMASDRVLRFDGIASDPDAQPVEVTAHFKLAPEQHHNWKTIRFGPEGKLYVPFGAPCNICEPGDTQAQIRRYNADGSGMEVIARGVRNPAGFDWHPVTGEMWFTDQGRDGAGDDGPEDELNRMSGNGLNFGFPYCHSNGIPDRDLRKARACDGVTLPVADMGPHAGAAGMRFYTGNMFPAEYKNALFVARKGSWNSTTKTGHDVAMVKADPDGKNVSITPFMTGFLNEKDDSLSGRPSYLAQMPDGSLLVSDEQLGAIYRVSYAK